MYVLLGKLSFVVLKPRLVIQRREKISKFQKIFVWQGKTDSKSLALNIAELTFIELLRSAT